MAGAQVITEGARTATARWCDHLAAAGDGDLLLRAGVPPQHLALYWQMLPEDVRDAGAWFVDVAAGQIYGRWAVDDAMIARQQVEQVRQPALALRGYAVVLAAPAAVLGEIDRWGYQADGAEVAAAIQRRWDPAGVLAA
jgi:hypothetical protein